MSGSKKGERRGAAKRGGRAVSGEVMGPTHGVDYRSRALPTKISEDYMRQIAMVVEDPERKRMAPRETLWDLQDYFYQEVLEFREMVRDLKRQIFAAQTAEERANLDHLLSWADYKVKELSQITGDFAFKALPYYHAKVTPDKDIEERDPATVIGILLREIDDMNRGRPTWMAPDLKLVSSK